ncbi:hypothetical protein [Sulfidibacter corallicola]|uniref:Uncharacterized protein n=1 Tax=Sulfidibacter corallicola TaxID=2818388 RepID=A0A8A4U6D7_SULCO|nr:hypothetical protein [Sulfidibacter corallicola]QTD54315.1 hypothetical protein J3U87_17865 [Sulfidibacter corallicola]
MKSRGLACALVANYLLCLTMLVYRAFSLVFSWDLFWHLKMGEDFVTKGLSPFVDHLSFTHGGEEIFYVPVAFQVALYEFVHYFGVLRGVQSFKLLFWVPAVTMLFLLLWRNKTHYLAHFFILPLATGAMIARAPARPELMTYPLVIIAIYLVWRAREHFTVKYMAMIAGLILVWNNLHVSSIFVYIVAGPLFIEKAIEYLKVKNFKPRDWGFLIGSGLALLAIGFLRHDLGHPILAALDFDPRWKSVTQEYLAFHSGLLKSYLRVSWGLLVILLFLLLQRGYYGFFITLLFMAYQSITAVRIFSIMIFMQMIVWAIVLPELSLEKIWYQLRRQLKTFALVFVWIVMIFNYGQLGYSLFRVPLMHSLRESHYPFGAIDQATRKQYKGKVYNKFDFGGFFAYYMAPEMKVYIDGRTNILYSYEFFRRYQHTYASIEVLREEDDRWGFDFILSDNDVADFRNYMRSGRFLLDTADASASLFRKNQGDLAVTGHLLIWPDCWDESLLDTLEEEYRFAAEHLPSRNWVRKILEYTHAYREAEDKEAFLQKPPPHLIQSDHVIRVASGIALARGSVKTSVSYLYLLKSKEVRDLQALAGRFLLLNEYQLSENLLYMAIHDENVPRLSAESTYRHRLLLDELRQTGHRFSIFPESELADFRLDEVQAEESPFPRSDCGLLDRFKAPVETVPAAEGAEPTRD